MAEILATLDDINAELPSDGQEPMVVADDDNTELLQISVARIVRGYLSRVVDNGVLVSWASPESTPELVSTIAGKLIASQLYFNETAKTTTILDPDSFAQKRYDEAMSLLNQIIAGTIVIPDIVVNPVEGLTDLDFFPVDSTGRAFTIGMEL